MCHSLKGDHRQEASTSGSLVFTCKQTLKGAVFFFGVECASVGDGIFLRDSWCSWLATEHVRWEGAFDHCFFFFLPPPPRKPYYKFWKNMCGSSKWPGVWRSQLAEGSWSWQGKAFWKKVWSETKRGHRTVPSAGEGLSIGHRFYVDQLTKDVHIWGCTVSENLLFICRDGQPARKQVCLLRLEGQCQPRGGHVLGCAT